MKRSIALITAAFCIFATGQAFCADGKPAGNRPKETSANGVQEYLSGARSVRVVYRSGDGYQSKVRGKLEIGMFGTGFSPAVAGPGVWIFRDVPPCLADRGVKKDGAYIPVGDKWHFVRTVDGRLSPDEAAAAFGIPAEAEKTEGLANRNLQRSDGSVFVMSPDGRKIADVSRTGNKQLVVMNSKKGKPYDAIARDYPVFSPDSRRIAYLAGLDGKRFAVVDGREGKRYDDVSGLIFSPDGRHVSYLAQAGGKHLVVSDEKEGTPYDGIVRNTLVYGPEGGHVAYVAMRGANQFLVLDGMEENPQANVLTKLTFSPDGGRLACVAKDHLGEFVFVTGTGRGDYYKRIYGCPVFSPDGRRVAYAALKGNNPVVVVDGAEGKRYEAVGAPSFSPDSVHVSYEAVLGGRHFLVVDGKEEEMPQKNASPEGAKTP
jgi:Tol biopolymer transport system component